MIAITPWLDPTAWIAWTAQDWTVLGVVVPVAAAAVGWIGSRTRRSRAMRPHLIWAPLHFHGREEPVRPRLSVRNRISRHQRRRRPRVARRRRLHHAHG